ncbi:MAG: AAA family ATPase, partial [Actinomycetota bacterium]|nr:AAA family ATPase [Actinomycetota bacterium]
MVGEIVGRDADLAAVQGFVARPVEGLRALVLEGDAGIGKSTLWRAGAAAARQCSFRVLESRPAETERTLPNVVLGDLFADVEPEALAGLTAPGRRAFESALLRAEPDLPIDPRALGVAILSLLRVLTDRQPLVIAIDDDQWMDPSSAATIGFALRRSLRQPILLLLSRRVGATLPTTLEATIDPDEVGRLRVGPLSMGATQQLLRHRLGIAFPKPTLVRLHEVSGGNPFYALELARVASADPPGGLTRPLPVPPSLEQVVHARLAGLAPSTRHALLIVAAHGRMLSDLLRDVGVAPDALEEARSTNVIEVSDGVIRFTHPLLASALYQGAADADRRAAHHRLTVAISDPIEQARHLALGADGPSE